MTLTELQQLRTKTEVYARVVGYVRPVSNWNAGKQSEYKDRIVFDVVRHD
jgi:anaerobic ribonucleoside-triphosphate reductase